MSRERERGGEKKSGREREGEREMKDYNVGTRF